MKLKKILIRSAVGLTLSTVLAPSTTIFANEEISTSKSINSRSETTQVDIQDEMVSNGYLIRDESNQTITLTEKYKQAVLSQVDRNKYAVQFTDNAVIITPKYQSRSSGGVNKIVHTWKGFDIYLSSSSVNAITTGAGITSLLNTMLPEPIITKGVAAALTASSLLLSHNNKGNGVIVAVAKIPTVPFGYTVHWVTSQ